MSELTALGLTCGIGSMLAGARQAGFEVLGNIEWRKYYHAADPLGRNTFRENFPESLFKESLDNLSLEEIERIMNPTLALGHPECGNFSQLSGSLRDRAARAQDPGDIPLFVDLVQDIKPRFFVMDDLPRSLEAFPMAEYARRLPEYDLYPEWVSNWGYGNVQKYRNRMFMVGSLRGERYAFVPGEVEHRLTVADSIGDLPEPRRGSNFPNHDPHCLTSDAPRALNCGGYRNKMTWGEVAEYFRDKPTGFTLQYIREDGRVVNRIGFVKGHWDGPAHVLTGGNASLHALRCTPLTVRERARIQGFPDDFVFYGTILNEDGEWDHDANRSTLVRQTGKAMPVQFCRYVSQQIADHAQGRPADPGRASRVIRPSEYVDAAKLWYCQNRGYSDQERACAACWLYAKCPVRARVYGIGAPPGRQPELPLEPTRLAAAPTPAERPQRARRSPIAAERVVTTRQPSAAVQRVLARPAPPMRDLEFDF